MNQLRDLLTPDDKATFLFFGGKGGVGKTTMATSVATYLADSGYDTTIVSTDPTISLGAMFRQEVSGVKPVPVKAVPNLSALTIDPDTATGVFQSRLNGITQQASGALGSIIATPCAAEMAAFDQFVGFLDAPPGNVVVFDTAPTGTTLRELAMPFDWAGFLQEQVAESREIAQLMGLDSSSNDSLEADKERYETALNVLRDRSSTVFTLVLTPERLPLEETVSAAKGLASLGIPIQSLIVNQVIEESVIEGNRFLKARSRLQGHYLAEIKSTFAEQVIAAIPLLDTDVSDVATVRAVAHALLGEFLERSA